MVLELNFSRPGATSLPTPASLRYQTQSSTFPRVPRGSKLSAKLGLSLRERRSLKMGRVRRRLKLGPHSSLLNRDGACRMGVGVRLK